MQLRNETGAQKINIRRPSRSTEEEAQRDLDQIRTAGAIGATREEGLRIMAAEAQRIKLTVEYQNEIKNYTTKGFFGDC